MRISDWSSDVCSSDHPRQVREVRASRQALRADRVDEEDGRRRQALLPQVSPSRTNQVSGDFEMTDVVIVDAIRTPMGRYRGGAFRTVSSEALSAHLIDRKSTRLNSSH